MNKKIQVGIADMKTTRDPGALITYALGSCVGVCLYDPRIKLAGMIHVMLPSIPSGSSDNILKYADSGIAETIRKMTALGASCDRMTAKIAGGAKMFDIPGDSNFGNIGKRNTESVKATLAKYRIRIAAEDTGSTHARTLEFFSADGSAVIRSYGRPDKLL